MALVFALLTIVTLFDSVIGMRIDGQVEAMALKQEVRLNEKLDAFYDEINELKDQISKLNDLPVLKRLSRLPPS